MDIHLKTLTVTKDDLDELNHVNNVRYIQWVNDAAKSHWLSQANPDILKQYFWVLVSHNIDYKREIKLGETVTLKTYVKSCQGLISLRVVEVLVNQTLCAYSETKWCFMSIKTQKPTRITPEITTLFQ